MPDSLSFPRGRWTRPDTLNEQEQQQAMLQLQSAPSALRQAVDGLSDEQLDTPYRPDGWTVRQLVHHLADSHLNMYIRVKLGLTEDTPTIKPYDQDAWAALADSREGPIEPSLLLFDGVHERLHQILMHTSPADRKRAVMHPESGRVTLEQLMSLYAWHGEHHVAHITELRARMNW